MHKHIKCDTIDMHAKQRFKSGCWKWCTFWELYVLFKKEKKGNYSHIDALIHRYNVYNLIATAHSKLDNFAQQSNFYRNW